MRVGEILKSIIEFKNITKKFGNFIANDEINIKIEKNSIHAIIGENGAGKTTLMNQLFGLCVPTSGKILINNKVVNISNPNEANELGLSMVHQHFQLVDNHTVLENIILGNEKSWLLSPIDFKWARSRLIEISKKYNLNINLNIFVKKASVAMQQRIEILKMLYQGSNILIFDEPTAMLTPKETEGLLELLKDLKKQGKTIIFISHKLQEVNDISDNATIIRKGKVIKSFKVANVSIKKMAEYMVGHKLIDVKNTTIFQGKKKILKIRNLSVANVYNPKALGLQRISLDLYEGEILAIAGVEGNGQLEFINAIFGLQKIKEGTIQFIDSNKLITLKNQDVNQRYVNKFSFVPEDRYKYAMLKNENLYVNSILQLFKFRPFSKYGILNNRKRNDLTNKIIKNYDVRGANAGFSKIFNLSGGNQQKFIVGREMIKSHKLLILFQPTRGLDIGAIRFIHKKILEKKQKGLAIILVSYELDEIMSMADRIAVFNNGKIINTVVNQKISRQQIGKWMAGVK